MRFAGGIEPGEQMLFVQILARLHEAREAAVGDPGVALLARLGLEPQAQGITLHLAMAGA